jgi:hypothetical protein
MATKRIRNEQAPVALEDLPRDTEALTNEEAVAARGGYCSEVLRMSFRYGMAAGDSYTTHDALSDAALSIIGAL